MKRAEVKITGPNITLRPLSVLLEPFELPADVLAGMRSYLDAMDLRYGCFDLVATAAAGSWPTSATPLVGDPR